MNLLERFDAWGDLLESKARTDEARLDALLREMTEARAAVAELIERERKQREVLDALCGAYIANRGSIGVHDFVRCVTPGGNRLSDTAIGRLWLQADSLARVGAP